MKHSAITGKIIGCAMKVHSWFGPGFKEIIYHRSLLIELKKAGLQCSSEVEKIVYYGNEIVGKRRLDIVVADSVLLELKAISELDNRAVNNILNYLKIFELEVGLLFNFGEQRLVFQRFVN